MRLKITSVTYQLADKPRRKYSTRRYHTQSIVEVHRCHGDRV